MWTVGKLDTGSPFGTLRPFCGHAASTARIELDGVWESQELSARILSSYLNGDRPRPSWLEGFIRVAPYCLCDPDARLCLWIFAECEDKELKMSVVCSVGDRLLDSPFYEEPRLEEFLREGVNFDLMLSIITEGFNSRHCGGPDAPTMSGGES